MNFLMNIYERIFYLVCKLLAEELTENFQQHNNPSVIETSYSLDAKQSKKTKYSDSYVLEMNFFMKIFDF